MGRLLSQMIKLLSKNGLNKNLCNRQIKESLFICNQIHTNNLFNLAQWFKLESHSPRVSYHITFKNNRRGIVRDRNVKHNNQKYKYIGDRVIVVTALWWAVTSLPTTTAGLLGQPRKVQSISLGRRKKLIRRWGNHVLFT